MRYGSAHGGEPPEDRGGSEQDDEEVELEELADARMMAMGKGGNLFGQP